MSYTDIADIADMLGKIFTKVSENGEELVFENDKEKFTFHHDQYCCEYVSIEDIVGDISDLENFPLLIAEECTNANEPENFKPEDYDSYTWTFYKFATIKGYVDVRWFGSSNGYYSEGVDLSYELKP